MKAAAASLHFRQAVQERVRHLSFQGGNAKRRTDLRKPYMVFGLPGHEVEEGMELDEGR